MQETSWESWVFWAYLGYKINFTGKGGPLITPGNKNQLERAEDQGWCGPLITCLDPPLRSVIGGGGPAGPLRPVGSAPTLLSNLHLKLAARGGKMMWVGVSTKLGRTQRQPPALADWEDTQRPCEDPPQGEV